MQDAAENLVNFVTSPGFTLTVKSLVWFLFAVHFAIAIWVARDAADRSKNILFQIFATGFAIFFPVFGLIFYLLLRPRATVSQKILDHIFLLKKFCPCCGFPVEDDFQFCPNCQEKILKTCKKKTCKKKFPVNFPLCPFCGTESAD